MEVVDYCPPGEVIQYVSAELRDELLSDREFVIEAMQQCGGEVLEHVSFALRGDADFVRQVCQLCPPQEAFYHATESVREVLGADRDFILELVDKTGAEALEVASAILLGDRDLCYLCQAHLERFCNMPQRI